MRDELKMKQILKFLVLTFLVNFNFLFAQEVNKKICIIAFEGEGVGEIKFQSTKEEILSSLGKDAICELFSDQDPPCNPIQRSLMLPDGERIKYEEFGLIFTISKKRDNLNRLESIEIKAPTSVITNRGIIAGESSLASVLEAYGEINMRMVFGRYLHLNYPDLGINFIFDLRETELEEEINMEKLVHYLSPNQVSQTIKKKLVVNEITIYPTKNN